MSTSYTYVRGLYSLLCGSSFSLRSAAPDMSCDPLHRTTRTVSTGIHHTPQYGLLTESCKQCTPNSQLCAHDASPWPALTPGKDGAQSQILGNSHSRVTTAAATARHIRMSALLVTMDVMKTFELFFLFGPLLFWCFLLPSHHNARQLEETRFSYMSTSPIVLLIVARLLIAPSCNDESPYVL